MECEKFFKFLRDHPDYFWEGSFQNEFFTLKSSQVENQNFSTVVLDHDIELAGRIIHYARFAQVHHKTSYFDWPVHGYNSADEVATRRFEFNGKDLVHLRVRIHLQRMEKLDTLIPKMDNHTMNAISDTVIICDAEPGDYRSLKILYANRAFEGLTGYSRDEVIGQTFDILPGPQTSQEELHKLHLGVKHWKPASAELINYKKNGETFVSEVRISPVSDETNWFTHWVVIQRDITEFKKLREQQMQHNHRERLAQIGELAAGVGHEINNPLAVISGYVQQIRILHQQRGLLDESSMAKFHKINIALKRITSIINGLRGLARVDAVEPHPFNVIDAIDQCISLMRDVYAKYSINLVVEYDEPEIWINGDMGKFQQCILNLVTNAKDAVLSSLIKNISISVSIKDKHVYISVKDSGTGISEDIREKIFNPFFTTKPVGQGTGMGLSLTMSLVKEMSGELSVVCHNVGSEFTLRFPVFSPPAVQNDFFNFEETLALIPPLNSVPTGTIAENPLTKYVAMVVDDEPDLRDILCEMLADLGFKVLSASNGREALERIRVHPIDVLITDSQMPIMNGEKLIAEIEKLNGAKPPKVFLVTGRVIAESQESGSAPEVRLGGFIEPIRLTKPFDLKSFRDTLTKMFTEDKASSSLETRSCN
ncbi:MAG: PAS domain-containing protein [Bdellovibrionales bacterium]|nr:PAS domain-containing protein [Bdellovibrionales bacterium]